MADSEERVLDLRILRRERGSIIRSVGMVGRLISEKPYNVFALIENVVKGFKMKIEGNVTAREVEKNLILFSFESIGNREKVIRHQPWLFHDELLAIAAVVGDSKPTVDLIKKVAIWTRVYDLPLDDHTEGILVAIAQEIGELIRYEAPDRPNLNSFIRFKIMIDIGKPLRKYIPLDLDGKRLLLPIRYEKLPTYCYGCGKI